MKNEKNIEDKELVGGCVANKRYYQELFYKRYFLKMMHMCLRHTQDRDQAQEIVNNGMLRAFKKMDTFAFKGSLEGWLRKLVYHALADYFKKHNKYTAFIILDEKDDTVHESAVSKLYAEDILKLVSTLPPASQRVFNLYAIEGYTHPEIAKKVGISVGTSKWHLSSARKELKKLINEQQNTNRYAR